MKKTELKEIKYYIDNYSKLFKSNYLIIVILLYIIHVIACLWQPYIIITLLLKYKNYALDKFFTIMLILIAFHWLFLKNECIISLIEKKLINKKYKMGTYCSLHPGLEYAGRKLKINPYGYNASQSKSFKIIKIIQTYIAPILTTLILSYRNNFFGNYNLWIGLNILHFIFLAYQYTQDQIIHS